MKAMVLCAGYGTRLGTLTKEIPKPMLPLLDAPLLAYVLAHLRAQGFCDLAINLHYRPEIIRNWLGDGSRWQVRVTYSEEETLLGTAGGLKKMEVFFQSEPAFLVQYGDILTDQDFSVLTRFHLEHRALATLLVHERAGSNSLVRLDATGRVIDFRERPSEEERRGLDTPWVNSGVCVCSPEVFERIPADRVCDLPRDIFSVLVSTGRVYGFPLSGYRCAIDSPARLEAARNALARGECRIRLHPLGSPGPSPANPWPESPR
jgi:NDP-sugar pyrophosphorylase family protein